MNIKKRIEAFNEENRPFYIVDHDDGKFSLCLPLDLLRGEYEDFGQAAFDAYAIEIGEPPVDSRGFQTHGNGYEWEAAFRQAFADDPNIGKILFDCEAGGFFCYTADLSLLEEYGAKFREICTDTEKFMPIVSQGIKHMEQWLAEQEKLMSTVRGAFLENPSSTFDIMTPDGNIRITPQDAKQLLDGDMQFVHIGGVQYCAFELLDQEIVQKQTDLFDGDIIRMKTQDPEQELGFKMTMYRHIPFTPQKWRKQAKNGQTPSMSRLIKKKCFGKKNSEIVEDALPQGIVVGCLGNKRKTTALIDTGDVHALMIGAAGVGKTAYWLYPCIEYACASGMSFLSTDTKGDIMRNYGNIAKEYGYQVSVIDLRNPTRSNGNNLLHLVNKYTDLYLGNPNQLVYKAKAEKYAKIIAKTIILSGMDAASFGQNAYFYDAAEGLLTATILLVAEFCKPEERHIVSVFKIIQELLAPSNQKGKNQFQQLMEMLPEDHKAKWYAGSAINGGEQSMASVMSTALSRLNAFLDSELEQLLCFDTEVDAEKFCSEKSAIFVIMPEENPNTFFMISLIIQQLYREILAVADEQGGKLKNRCVFFCDEYGTLPKIQDAEMMFSASRSRRLQIVPIIQSFSQLDKNYGKEGAEIIVDNTQLTIFGGFAPNSSSAEILSKALGNRTVMSGSVSRGKNDPSASLQMMERPLMTPDELKSMPKGQFFVMKTGAHPMKVRLKLFFEWGIEFDKDNPYAVPENANREVKYAEKREIIDGIVKKYHPDWLEKKAAKAPAGDGMAQTESQSNEPQRTPPRKSGKAKTGGTPIRTAPERKPINSKTEGQEEQAYAQT